MVVVKFKNSKKGKGANQDGHPPPPPQLGGHNVDGPPPPHPPRLTRQPAVGGHINPGQPGQPGIFQLPPYDPNNIHPVVQPPGLPDFFTQGRFRRNKSTKKSLRKSKPKKSLRKSTKKSKSRKYNRRI